MENTWWETVCSCYKTLSLVFRNSILYNFYFLIFYECLLYKDRCDLYNLKNLWKPGPPIEAPDLDLQRFVDLGFGENQEIVLKPQDLQRLWVLEVVTFESDLVTAKDWTCEERRKGAQGLIVRPLASS